MGQLMFNPELAIKVWLGYWGIFFPRSKARNTLTAGDRE